METPGPGFEPGWAVKPSGLASHRDRPYSATPTNVCIINLTGNCLKSIWKINPYDRMRNIGDKAKSASSYWFKRLLNPTKKDLILTLVIWTLLPAPDLGQIISRGGNIQWLPGIAPANFFYGLSSLIFPISRLVMWGELPWGGFAIPHLIDMFSTSIPYLLAAYLTSVVLMEKRPWSGLNSVGS